jgi:hypothetical protein
VLFSDELVAALSLPLSPELQATAKKMTPETIAN